MSKQIYINNSNIKKKLYNEIRDDLMISDHNYNFSLNLIKADYF